MAEAKYLHQNRLLQNQSMLTCQRIQVLQSNTSFIHFPFNNFRYFLTLFSKFFSSFPHGTCSLSVSRQYLALDGIYHPIGAPFPKNSTLRKRPVERRWLGRRGSHPLWCPIPGDLGRGRRRGSDLKTTIQKPQGLRIFKLGSSRFTRRY